MSNSEFAEPYTIIEPFGGPFKGDVTVPGDKSISHRAVLFAAMAEGTSHLSGVLDSEDVRASIRAVEALGAVVSLDRQADGTLTGTVTGWGAEGPSQPDAPIDCGNSGTTARLLMGIVAPWDIKVTITGDESLKKRPMRRIVAPLAKMGVDFVPETPETLPITVCGNRALRAIDYASPMASAQLKTAVLLAGVFADGAPTKTFQADEGGTYWLPEAPSRFGYEFLGWTNQSTGSLFAAGVGLVMGADSVAYTASWKASPSSIVLDAVGGSFGGGAQTITLEGETSALVDHAAASTPVRLTPLPEVPTLREQGWDEAVEMYIVLVGPKNLPADVRERLNAAVAALKNNQGFQTFIHEKLRMGPVEFGPEHAVDYMKRTAARNAAQAKETAGAGK